MIKTALITGASRGIGAETAKLLAKDHSIIGIISRNADGSLEKLAEEIIEQTACTCIAYSGDVSDYEFIKMVVADLIERGEGIDTLVNNAGISMVGLFQDMSPEDFQKIFQVNVTSVYNTCHAVLPGMINRQSGKIINVSSVWGLVGASCEVAYSATKGAINSMTKALAKEVAPSHISVNAVAFGAVDTTMNGHLTEEEKQMLCDEIPAGKMATPEEAAKCIKQLLDMPEYFTGEVVKIDGGWI